MIIILSLSNLSAQCFRKVDTAINCFNLNLDSIYFKQYSFKESVNFASAKIRGKANFEMCCFNHNADFGGTTFQSSCDFNNTSFNGMILFNSSSYNEEVDFMGCQFHDELLMEGAKFYGQVRFLGASFIQNAVLRNIQFSDASEFSQTTFKNGIDFRYSNFLEIAYIKNCSFAGNTNWREMQLSKTIFDGSVFQNKTQFDKSVFKDTISFKDCSFNEDLSFKDVVFKSDVYFSRAKFRKDVSFENAKFLGNVYFSECTFEGDVNLNRALFLGKIHFDYVHNISQRIDLTNILTDTADHKRRCGANIYGADISKLKLDYSHFSIEFPENGESYEYKLNVYRSLLKNFEDDGFTESYELLDKEYQDIVNMHNKKWVMNFIEKFWWDYGYAKGRVFMWIIVFVLFFSVINIYLYPKLQQEVYKLDNVTIVEKRNDFKTYLKASYNSLIYTMIIFFSINVKTEKLKFKRWGLLLYFFLIYLCGIICLAYAANFVLKN